LGGTKELTWNDVRYSLEAFLDDVPLGRERRGSDHPSFVIEVAENDRHASTDLAKSIGDRYSNIIKCDVSSTSSG
jgi:hypothetical protein